MRTVLITGASGFIGRNLCTRLAAEPATQLLRFTRSNTAAELKEMVDQADFVFHLAAVMRPPDATDFKTHNIDLTSRILELVHRAGRKAPVLFASSTQADLPNDYGLSKKAAESHIADWAASHGHTAYVYRLPNVFGPWANLKTSVVAIFSHNLTHGEAINVHEPAKLMTLAYIDDVIDEFLLCLNGQKLDRPTGTLGIPRTYNMSLQQLADTLEEFEHARKDGNQPTLSDPIDKPLWQTFKWFATDQSEPIY